MANALEHGVRLSQTSPKFLHANSTSHTWIFSAFAELIDNAYDPDVAATQLFIDKKNIQNETCLVFTDNGSGMEPEKLHRMLSFGYCEKVEIDGHKPVGHYGNGFKSGSMRLGVDSIVLTKHTSLMSVGFLSQTFLRKIQAQTVLVPIVSWDVKTKQLVQKADTRGSLDAITNHSLFKSERTLLAELEAMANFKTGTRIIIYNLKRGSDDHYELDFESNPTDIINPERYEMDFSTRMRPVREYQPEYKRSLREYCSILFLKPRMKIILRGEKVSTKLVSKSLRETEKDVYKPVWLPRPVKIVFGFGQSKMDCGLMMYHRNRLIKAYEKVGIQKQGGGQGEGVVGIVEVDFLEPIHNKQDFNKTDRYNACINSLGQKLTDYWNEKSNTPKMVGDVMIIDPDYQSSDLPDWTWVQCDNCLKWRRLPDGMSGRDLPKRWFCYMNPDPHHSRCDVEEEPEDEDELLLRATYKKTHKSKQMKEKAQKRMSVDDKERELNRKEQELRQMHRQLKKMQPLDEKNHRHGQDKKPTVADLEKAQRELEEAKRNEEAQKKVIKELKRQKREMEAQKERAVQEAKRNNSLVETAVQNTVNSSSSSKRRHGNINTSGLFKSKKPRIEMQTDDIVVTRANDSDTDDENCIIIDDSDLDKPRRNKDRKPDVNKLNQQMNQSPGRKGRQVPPPAAAAGSPRQQHQQQLPQLTQITHISQQPNRQQQQRMNTPQQMAMQRPPNMQQHRGVLPRPPMQRMPQMANGGFPTPRGIPPGIPPPGIPPARPRGRPPRPQMFAPPPPPRNIVPTVEVGIQTELGESSPEFVATRRKLRLLRRNVSSLLRVILPELEIADNALIDDIVSEMIKVNGGQPCEEDDEDEVPKEIKEEESEKSSESTKNNGDATKNAEESVKNSEEASKNAEESVKNAEESSKNTKESSKNTKDVSKSPGENADTAEIDQERADTPEMSSGAPSPLPTDGASGKSSSDDKDAGSGSSGVVSPITEKELQDLQTPDKVSSAKSDALDASDTPAPARLDVIDDIAGDFTESTEESSAEQQESISQAIRALDDLNKLADGGIDSQVKVKEEDKGHEVTERSGGEGQPEVTKESEMSGETKTGENGDKPDTADKDTDNTAEESMDTSEKDEETTDMDVDQSSEHSPKDSTAEANIDKHQNSPVDTSEPTASGNISVESSSSKTSDIDTAAVSSEQREIEHRLSIEEECNKLWVESSENDEVSGHKEDQSEMDTDIDNAGQSSQVEGHVEGQSKDIDQGQSTDSEIQTNSPKPASIPVQDTEETVESPKSAASIPSAPAAETSVTSPGEGESIEATASSPPASISPAPAADAVDVSLAETGMIEATASSPASTSTAPAAHTVDASPAETGAIEDTSSPASISPALAANAVDVSPAEPSAIEATTSAPVPVVVSPGQAKSPAQIDASQGFDIEATSDSSHHGNKDNNHGDDESKDNEPSADGDELSKEASVASSPDIASPQSPTTLPKSPKPDEDSDFKIPASPNIRPLSPTSQNPPTPPSSSPTASPMLLQSSSMLPQVSDSVADLLDSSQLVADDFSDEEEEDKSDPIPVDHLAMAAIYSDDPTSKSTLSKDLSMQGEETQIDVEVKSRSESVVDFQVKDESDSEKTVKDSDSQLKTSDENHSKSESPVQGVAEEKSQSEGVDSQIEETEKQENIALDSALSDSLSDMGQS